MLLTYRQQQILDFIQQHTVQGGSPSLWEIAQAFGMRQTGGVRKHLQVLEKKGYLSLVQGTARGIRLRAYDGATIAGVGGSGKATAQVAAGGSAKTTTPRNATKHPSLLALPVLGRVAAGKPIGAAEDLDELAPLLFERSLFSPQPDFLLRVKGDSMRDDGILDGDLVAVRRSESAENGQIVVARVDGEITIKRLLRTTLKQRSDSVNQTLKQRSDSVNQTLKQRSDSAQQTTIQLLPRNPAYAAIVVPAQADFAIVGIYCGLVRRG